MSVRLVFLRLGTFLGIPTGQPNSFFFFRCFFIFLAEISPGSSTCKAMSQRALCSSTAVICLTVISSRGGGFKSSWSMLRMISPRPSEKTRKRVTRTNLSRPVPGSLPPSLSGEVFAAGEGAERRFHRDSGLRCAGAT